MLSKKKTIKTISLTVTGLSVIVTALSVPSYFTNGGFVQTSLSGHVSTKGNLLALALFRQQLSLRIDITRSLFVVKQAIQLSCTLNTSFQNSLFCLI